MTDERLLLLFCNQLPPDSEACFFVDDCTESLSTGTDLIESTSVCSIALVLASFDLCDYSKDDLAILLQQMFSESFEDFRILRRNRRLWKRSIKNLIDEMEADSLMEYPMRVAYRADSAMARKEAISIIEEAVYKKWYEFWC